jgi:nicotinate dehydrogenase subunit A
MPYTVEMRAMGIFSRSYAAMQYSQDQKFLHKFANNKLFQSKITSGEGGMVHTYTLVVNGHAKKITADDPKMPLLYGLRNDLGLHGPRFGCGLGQCGACTVHVDGHPVRSCSVSLDSVAGKHITTLEGLGSLEKPHPIQQAFIDEQAAQCGYCINGMIMQAKALLDKNRNPSEEDIRKALALNLCRCGTHLRIIRAVQRAAAAMA